MRVNLKFEGAAEIEKALKKLSTKAVERTGKKALSAGGRIVRDEAKAMVREKSGSLRKSIKVLVRRSRGNVIRVTVSATALHARLVEMGTGPRYYITKNGHKKYIGHMPAKPFLRPAMDVSRDEALHTYKRVMWSGIKKEVVKR